MTWDGLSPFSLLEVSVYYYLYEKKVTEAYLIKFITFNRVGILK